MKLFMAVLFATLALNGVLSLPGKWVKKLYITYLHTYIWLYMYISKISSTTCSLVFFYFEFY